MMRWRAIICPGYRPGAQGTEHRNLKYNILREVPALRLDYSMTWSCYNPTPKGLACGLCDSCQLRLKGFKEAGFKDPILYAMNEHHL